MKFIYPALALTFVASFASAQNTAQSANDRVTRECNKVFQEARRLPAPTPKSIKNYNERVVEQGGRCLKAGFEALTGSKSTDNDG
jgi:hypothetical protein